MPIPILVGLGIGAAGLGLGALGATLFKGDKSTPQTKPSLALLDGETGAGKTTLYRIFQGDVKNLKKNIASNKKQGFSMGYWQAYDTPGSFANVAEEISNQLSPNDLLIYVFNAKEYYSNKNIQQGIKYAINLAKKTKAELKIIGTRGGKIFNKQKIENEVRMLSSNVDCKIFELVNGVVEDDYPEKLKKFFNAVWIRRITITDMQDEILEFLRS